MTCRWPSVADDEDLACDFCNGPCDRETMRVIEVGPFKLAEINYINLSRTWGGCDECMNLVREDQWEALYKRAETSHHAKATRMIPEVKIVWAGLAANRIGPVRPVEDADFLYPSWPNPF